MDLTNKQKNFNENFIMHVKKLIKKIKNLLNENKIKLIIQILKKEINLFNNNPFAINLYSHIILTYKPNFELIEYCHEILLKIYSIFPEDIFTLYNLGWFNIYNEKYQNALDFFNDIDNLKPNDIDIHFNISYCLEKLENENSIKAYLEIILNIITEIKNNNDNVQIKKNFEKSFKSFINYSNILTKNGKYTLAEGLLEKYYLIKKDNIQINNNWLLNKIEQNKLSTKEYEKEILKLNFNKKEVNNLKEDWITKFNLGINLIKQNNFYKAIEEIEPIFNNCPDKNLVWLSGINLGKIYEQLNQDEFAIKIYKKIINKFKNSINLTDIINRIDELNEKIDKNLDTSIKSYVENVSQSLTDIINFDLEKSFSENEDNDKEEFCLLKDDLFGDINNLVEELNDTSYYKSFVDEIENEKEKKSLENKILTLSKSIIKSNNNNNDSFELNNSISIKNKSDNKKNKTVKILEKEETKSDLFKKKDSQSKVYNSSRRIKEEKEKKEKIKTIIEEWEKNKLKNKFEFDNFVCNYLDEVYEMTNKYQIYKLNDINKISDQIYKLNNIDKICEIEIDRNNTENSNLINSELENIVISLEDLNIIEIEEKLEKDPKNFLLNYQLAILNLYNNDINSFKKILIKLHKINPNFKKNIINKALGDLLYKEKKYDKALYFYSIIFKTKKSDKIKLKIIKCFIKINKLEPAINLLKEINEKNNTNIKILYLLGKTYLLKNNINKSKEYFLNILKFEENNYKSFIKLAEIIFLEKKPNLLNIKKYWEKAIIIGIERDKDIIKTYRLLSKALLKLNKKESAVEYLKKILNIKHNNIEVRKDLANLYLNMDNFKQAIKEYKLILNIDKENIEICCIIGTIYALDKNYSKAIKYLKQVNYLDPGNFEANIKLAKIYRDTINDFKNAKVYFNEILKRDEKNYKLYYELAITELKLNNDAGCLKNMKECLIINNEFVDGWLFLGDFYIMKKNYESSLNFYEKAINLDKNNIKGNEGILKCWFKLNSYNECINYFNKIEKLNFQDKNIFLLLADCYIALKKLNYAKEFLERSIKFGINNIKIQTKLGKIYLKLKLYDKSKEIYLNLIDLDENNYIYYKNIGNIYSIERKFDSALEYYKKAFELNNNIQIHYLIALVYLELGDYQQSKLYYEKIIKLDQNNPKAHIKWAYLYSKFGNNQMALIEYEKANKLMPNDNKLKEIIIQLKNKIFSF